MIYVISRKFLEKQGAKLAAPNDYLIIDGENFGNNASGTDEPISQKYNHTMIRSGFSPERETLNIFRKKKAGKEYSEKKLKNQLKEFFKSPDFLAAALFAMKAQGVYGVDNDINVYVCLPNIVYKNIGNQVAIIIQELSRVDFKFVFTEDTIKETKRQCLEKKLKPKKLKEINKVVNKIGKKYDIKAKNHDEDDW